MKKCTLVLVSPAYAAQRAVQVKSLNKFLPEYDHIQIDLPSDITLTEVCRQRPTRVLEQFARGYDVVFFLGSDVVFYKRFYGPEDYDSGDPVLGLVPHSTAPADYFAMRKTGIYNSDYCYWEKHDSPKFLKWQAEQLQKKCDQESFLDQVYLELAPSFVEQFKAFDPSYHNVAFYNIHQERRAEDIVSFQFSGFDPNDPLRISKHWGGPRVHPESHIGKLLLQYRDDLLTAQKDIDSSIRMP